MVLFDMINHADEVNTVDSPLLLGQLAMTAPKSVPLRC